MTRFALLAALPLLASACGATPASVCARLDECNLLATGVSVSQCVENVEQAVDGLTESRRADCFDDLTEALGNASCENFAADFSSAACGGGGGGVDTGF